MNEDLAMDVTGIVLLVLGAIAFGLCMCALCIMIGDNPVNHSHLV